MSARRIREIIAEQDLLTADVGMTVREAAQAMKERVVGAVVVLREGRLAGIFTERDALFRVVAEGLDPTATTVETAMTADPTTIHPDKPFATALEVMHEGRFRHVPVVEDGNVVGMVSSRDAMGPELEQFMYALIAEEHNRDILA